MSILTTPLDDCIMIGDKGYKLKTDFRIWIELERIMQDKSITPDDKIVRIYDLCFEEPPPYGVALDAVMEFYTGSTQEKSNGKKLLSFEKDGDYIYSAFYAQYGIDLTTAKLHWHRFKALFAGLNSEHMIVKIMQIRGMDISKIKDQTQKAHYRRLKRLYRIENPDMDGLEFLF